MNSVTSNDFNKAFGEFIRSGRRQKRLSQLELATYLGITQSHLSRVEQGIRGIDFELAVKMCSYIGLDLNEFMKLTCES